MFLFDDPVVQYVSRHQSSKRRRGERNHWVHGLDQSQIETRGDKRPDFLYF